MKKVLFVLVFIVFIGLPDISSAFSCTGGLVPCEPNKCTLCDFFVLVGNIINFVLFCILPPLAILMLAFAGFMYVAAYFGPGGAPETIKRAQTLLKAIFFGLLIAYAGWLIIDTVLFVLGVKPMFSSWNEINCGLSPGGK